MALTSKLPVFYVEDDDANRVYEQAEFLKTLISDFSQALGIDIYEGTSDLCDVVRAYSRDMAKLIKVDSIAPNEFKQAGYLGFWIRKLKPLYKHERNAGKDILSSEDDKILKIYLNEVFATYLAVAMVLVIQQSKRKIDREMIGERIMNNKELLHELRYRSVAPHVFANYLKSFFNISIFLFPRFADHISA